MIVEKDAEIKRLRAAGERFREAIAGDYAKDGPKVTCNVFAESLGEFHEAFRNRKENGR